MKNGFSSLGVFLLFCVGLSAGCASNESHDLTLVSGKSGQAYMQHFERGYLSRDGQGDTDVVLALETDHPAGRPGVLKQIMHIRLLWKSDRMTTWEGAANDNASIRWYVFTDRPGRPEMIEYAGTGTVVLTAEKDQTIVSVRNAQLHPVFARGDLTDPIGPSKFQGTIIALPDRPHVDQLLSEVRTTLAATSLPAQPAEAKTAEARIQVNP